MNGLKHFFFLIYVIPFIGLSQNDSVYTQKVNKNEIVHQCFNKITKKPIVFPDYSYGLHVSAIVSVSDALGNRVMSFKDTLGNPTHDGDSIYVYKMKEDPREIYSETRYYYLNNIEAHSGDYWLHDKKGRELESGQIRMNDTAKINFWKTVYNKQGNILSYTFYSSRYVIADSDPYSDLNYSILNYKYDANGNFLGAAYYDSQGKLVNDQEVAYSFVIYKYNNRNKVTEIGWYDKDSVLVNSNPYNTNFAKILFRYDKKGRLAEIYLQSVENGPGYGIIDGYEIIDCYKKGYLNQDRRRLFTKKIYEYNVFGQIIAEEYFDEYSKNIAGSYYKYFFCVKRSAKVLPN